MKVFQILNKYNQYIPFFENKYDVDAMSYEAHRRTLIKDRFYGLHLLQPILNLEEGSFYTLWNYEKLQLKWAREKGWKETDLKKILFAQLEEYQPDVFYNCAPSSFSPEEMARNIPPSAIKVCWSASPYDQEEVFKSYASRLTNVPADIKPKAVCGYRNDYFTPAYDSAMERYGKNEDRPIDLFFYGQYEDNAFKTRNKFIDDLLEFKLSEPERNIKICLQYRLRKEPVVNIPYIRRFWQKTVYPSERVLANVDPPTYGLSLYEVLSKSKIVFNAGVDYSGKYKVNMRNFEVLGCGAHMISDRGIYPEGFKMDEHFSTYGSTEECLEKIKSLLEDESLRRRIAQAGNAFITKNYTKEQQWQQFQNIIADL